MGKIGFRELGLNCQYLGPKGPTFGSLLVSRTPGRPPSNELNNRVKGTQMGPLLVLVSPCFRDNVNVTCKIVSFLCILDNFLLKNAIVFFL